MQLPLWTMEISIERIIARAEEHAKVFMSQQDDSHDWSHIQRVLALARVLEADMPAGDEHVVTLCCLLHDIGDHKYVQHGQDGETMVERLLLSFGAERALATKIQLIVNNVSYSKEKRDSSEVLRVAALHPELAIVQDADRLDSLGAVGIGRTFTYNATRSAEGMQSAIDHLHDKLVNVHLTMKTRLGRQMAEKRTQRLLLFAKWWSDELDDILPVDINSSNAQDVA